MQLLSDKCQVWRTLDSHFFFFFCTDAKGIQVHKETELSRTSIPGTLSRIGMVRAFVHGAMGRRIDPSLGGPIELFLVPVIAPRLV